MWIFQTVLLRVIIPFYSYLAWIFYIFWTAEGDTGYGGAICFASNSVNISIIDVIFKDCIAGT